jgi:hypothetical protein
MKIRVNIGRLVLDGLPVTPAQGPQVRRAVEAELARLLATTDPRGLARFAGASPAARAPGLSLDGGEGPRALGARIARSVHGALQPPTGSAGR